MLISSEATIVLEVLEQISVSQPVCRGTLVQREKTSGVPRNFSIKFYQDFITLKKMIYNALKHILSQISDLWYNFF